MLVSLVIPTHRRQDKLMELLRSITHQSLVGIDREIIIVSNLEDSFFKTSKFIDLQKKMDVQVFVAGQVGVNRARNLGLQHSQGQIVFFFDDDCRLDDPHFIEKVCFLHEKNPGVLAIGGTYKLGSEANCVDKAYNLISRHWQALDYYGEYESHRLVGGNLSYKRNMLMESGLSFDESIVYGGSEAEFHQRLKRKGYAASFIESLQVTHASGMTQSDLIKKAYAQAQGHNHYDIDAGFSERSNWTYHHKKVVWAWEVSQTQAEFDQICNYMELYNQTYNLVCRNPEISLAAVEKRAQRSLKQSLSIEGGYW